MPRIKIVIILCLIYSWSSAQTDADFPADLIKEAQIDSCIIRGDFANYPQKYSFDKEGRITSHSFPTSYHPSADSVVYGIFITTYYYDSKGRLFKKTMKADFGRDSFSIPETLSEWLVYDLNDKLLTHLFYASYLEKMISFQYEGGQLSFETSYNFLKSSETKRPQTQATKRFYQNNSWARYDNAGNIQDSLVRVVDSSAFIETSFYYNFKKHRLRTENPEVFIYQFDPQWRIIEIIHKYGNRQSTDKYYRNENGLLTKIEHLGTEDYIITLEYK